MALEWMFPLGALPSVVVFVSGSLRFLHRVFVAPVRSSKALGLLSSSGTMRCLPVYFTPSSLVLGLSLLVNMHRRKTDRRS
ncbi:MAG: hypothetical protein ACJARS_004086 [bacterium]|jgi:hypothetical protein